MEPEPDSDRAQLHLRLRSGMAVAFGILSFLLAQWMLPSRLIAEKSKIQKARAGPSVAKSREANKKRKPPDWSQAVQVREIGFTETAEFREKSRSPAGLLTSTSVRLEARIDASRPVTLVGPWGSAQDPDGFPELKIPVIISKVAGVSTPLPSPVATPSPQATQSPQSKEMASGTESPPAEATPPDSASAPQTSDEAVLSVTGPDLTPSTKVEGGELLWLTLDQVDHPTAHILVSGPGLPLQSRTLAIKMSVKEDQFILRPECKEMDLKMKRITPSPLGGVFLVNCEKTDDYMTVAIHTHLNPQWKGVLKGSRVVRGGRVLWRTVNVGEVVREPTLLNTFSLEAGGVQGRYAVSMEPDPLRPALLNPYRWWGNFELNLMTVFLSGYSFFTVEPGWSPTFFFAKAPVVLRGHWDFSFARSPKGVFAFIHSLGVAGGYVGLRPFSFEAMVGVETFVTVGTSFMTGVDVSWLLRKWMIDRATISYRAAISGSGVGHELRIGFGFGF